MSLLVADARAQWAELDRRIEAFDAEFVRCVKDNEDARRLTTIPGFGAILVARQSATGGKPKLLGISKRGNSYLHRQLIHGARAALPYVAERDTPLGRWAKALLERTHRNVTIVAPPTSWLGSPGRC